jgi:formylglycine-generating enzyme required for sulfatase activity
MLTSRRSRVSNLTGPLLLLSLLHCSRDNRPPPPAIDAAVAAPAATTYAAPIDASADTETGTERAPSGMLRVPAGSFTMGADRGGEADERPAHTVTLDAFWLDRTEVTHEAYRACVVAKVCRPSAADVARQYPGSQGASHPVNGVGWDDAQTYCAWMRKRLPREAEFEKAVRGTDARRYPWGNDKPTQSLTVFARATGPDVGQTTDPVGSHPDGRGPYGHDDLAGNLWEWMDDPYDPFAYGRPTAPEGKPAGCKEILAAQDNLRASGRHGFTGSNPVPDECERAIRGGAFNYPPEGLRATNRVHHPTRTRIVMLGFRCAMDARR